MNERREGEASICTQALWQRHHGERRHKTYHEVPSRIHTVPLGALKWIIRALPSQSNFSMRCALKHYAWRIRRPWDATAAMAGVHMSESHKKETVKKKKKRICCAKKTLLCTRNKKNTTDRIKRSFPSNWVSINSKAVRSATRPPGNKWASCTDMLHILHIIIMAVWKTLLACQSDRRAHSCQRSSQKKKSDQKTKTRRCEMCPLFALWTYYRSQCKEGDCSLLLHWLLDHSVDLQYPYRSGCRRYPEGYCMIEANARRGMQPPPSSISVRS